MDVSLMHWPSGNGPAFWSALGGVVYRLTVDRPLCRSSDGESLSRERVLVSAHRPMVLDEPKSSPLASSAALELMKYSVPPLALAYWWVPGLIAGHTVKPGSPPRVLAVPAAVLIWTMCTLASPRARARLDMA